MPSTKEISRRIKSIKSTRKVTRAMQMVSASKMRKAQGAALASRKYAELAGELVTSMQYVESSMSLRGARAWTSDAAIPASHNGIASSPSLLAMTATKLAGDKKLIILISSNRGLVGSFNSNLFSKVRELEPSPLTPLPRKAAGEGNHAPDYIVMGRKASDTAARLGKNIIADFSKPEGVPTTEDIYSIAKLITEKFDSGEYAEVLVVYNHFVSTLSQQVRVRRLLPYSDANNTSDTPETRMSKLEQTRNSPTRQLVTAADYLFEPSPAELLSNLLPRILESQLYQCLLESDASEHSARMVMMKNATEAAGDLVADLTLTYNQLRQGKITTELSEITAGKIALE